MSTRPVQDYYYDAITAALAAHDVKAVPALLVAMALDGYGHEAETLRRDMSRASASRAAQQATEPGARSTQP